ncbi:hypothetical protein LBAT_0117 [Lactobacillus acetotolerans]|uniref:Uncharacterized protein n=1 Tax=Lactobacillus acetotolerans TaxID=1600 RepID=A0A0D6A194_9LACO|nr:hypothetical protein [Lactobacillus acetotolerans]BAQ56506.1 hypothetical protein LBAT_0117 [Lactobacillus acetotolerans]
MDLKDLHDYVKNNYEKGKYSDAEEKYKNAGKYYSKKKYYFNKSNTNNHKTSDYKLGYDQAINDYKHNKSFHTYPKNAVNLGNSISKGKMNEVSDFIDGYNTAKEIIIRNMN